jgi:CO/xanthine dehydrogenase FAD-binding subunit
MNLWQEYLRPTTVSQALQALKTASTSGISIAGGTDLLLDLQQGRHSPVHTLVDLNSIAEMTAIELRDDEFFIGASVPVNRIVLDPLAGAHAQALIEAARLIGGPQVRNTATLGGNVAHALPAADGTIALTALNTQAEIASLSGTRRVPFTSLYLGPGKSALKKGEELVVGFYLRQIKKGQASCFKRIMRPQGVALPIINTAIWLERENDTIKEIRIAVGPAGPTPFRAIKTEDALRGQKYSDFAINKALDALLAEAKFRTSPQRASTEYRQHLAVVLFKDTLRTTWERAGKD